MDTYFPVYFLPDADPAWGVNPGLLIDVSDAVPTKRKTLKTYLGQLLPDFSFAAATYGTPLFGRIFRRVDGTARLIVGTTASLMEYNAASGWTDETHASPSIATNWTFAAYGNEVFAASKVNALVSSSTIGGQFVAVSGSPPKASCIAVNRDFVMLGDTNDGVDDLGDRLWWSGQGNSATWAPLAATKAGNLRLRATPGPIRCLENLRDAIIAYKGDSMYAVEYRGSPVLWEERLISDNVGCDSRHGVASVGGVHYFLHRTGLYRFDGGSLQLISAGAGRYVLSKMGQNFYYTTVQATVDEHEGNIYFYFGASGTSANERRYALVYNYLTGAFGFVANAFPVPGSNPCYSIVRASSGDIIAATSVYTATQTNVMLIGTGNGAQTLRVPVFGSAASGATMSITTGDIGDETKFTTLTRIKPRHLTVGATSNSATVYGKKYEGGSYDAGDTFTADSTRHRYDGTKSARWLRALLTFTSAETAGLSLRTSEYASEE